MATKRDSDDSGDDTSQEDLEDTIRPRDQDGGDGRRKAREDHGVGGNAGLVPEAVVGSTRRSYTSESNDDYQDMITVDETLNTDGVALGAAAPSLLDNVLRTIKREEGESTEAILVRLLARALLNEQPRNEVPRGEVPRGEVPLYHVIPDLSKNIENFTGDGKGVRPRDWINNIESMRKIHKWPENFALETARMHLRGGARDWYRARATTLVNWETFKLAFEATFVIPESTSDRWQRMINRVQQKDESLSAYYHAKTKLCIDLRLEFRDIKEQVLDGLWSKELCISLMARNHHSLDDLLHDIIANERVLAQRATRIRASKESGKPKPQGTLSSKTASTSKEEKQGPSTSSSKPTNPDKRPPVTNDDGQPKCYNCKAFGHIARDCPEEPRELICKQCKKKGHTQRHCPEVKSTNKAEVNLINEVNNNSIGKYIKSVKINGRQMRALIDPGSSDCTMKATRVLTERFEVIPVQSDLKGFGPAHYVVTSPGLVRAEIDVDDVVVPDILVRIVPDDTQSYDAIIGRSFTEQPYVEYRKSGDELTFAKREDSYLTVIEPSETANTTMDATVLTDVVVPPSSIQFIDTVSDTKHYEFAVLNMGVASKTMFQGQCVERGDVSRLPMVPRVTAKKPITRQDLIIGEDQPEDVIEELVAIMNEYRDCVALNLSELGLATNIAMDIQELPGSKPVVSKPYRASNSEREEISRIIREWREAGIVRDTDSPYASPVLLVRKKNGESRLVVDFRKLNRQTIRVPFPMPNPDDHLEQVRDCDLFITLDLAHGYLQVPLTEEAIPKTAIITPDETVECTRMIFGLLNGPAYFTKTMDKSVGPLRGRVILYYLDDIFIPGRNWPDLRERLVLTLKALRESGLTIKLSKCRFLQKRVSYLGFEISNKGIEPGESKVKAIIDYPTPTNVHETRRFIGMASFFRRFIPKFAQIAAPLHKLLKSEAKFMWCENEQRAFDKLKEMLSNKPILQPFDPRRETELHTDASAMGLAAMMFQRDEQKRLRLVYAISRRTSEPEKNYHSSKLELLAIVWAVTRLRTMLINIPFTIVTDCQALLYLSTQKTVNPQVVRWNNTLSEFNFNITHKPGTKLAHVDALSRAPVCGSERMDEYGVFTLVNEYDEIVMNQCSDEMLARKSEILRKAVNERSKHEVSEIEGYEVVNGIVYKRQGERLLFAVPRAMRKGLAIRFHDLKGHPGLDRSIAMLTEHYYYPGVRRYMRQHIGACIQCALTKVKTGKQSGLLHPIPPGERPFAVIHVDHTGPFVTTKKGNKYILAIIDNLTKYVILHAAKDTKVSGVIRALEKFVQEHGAPRKIISDRGTCFTSSRFAEFCSAHGIHHTLNSPRHPQANGQIERVNCTLIPVLQASLQDNEGRDWDSKLLEAQRNLNNAPNATTRKSAFELLYGYRASRNEGELRKVTDESTSYTPPEELQQAARERIDTEQQRVKKRYDQNRAKNIRYRVGDIVYMRVAPIATGESTKLQRKYRGPLTVTRVLHEDTYQVADLRQEKPGRRYASTAHASQLKIWRPHKEDSSSEEESDDGDVEEEPQKEKPIREQEDGETTRKPDAEENENENPQTRRSKRERRVPVHLRDYETQLPEDE